MTESKIHWQRYFARKFCVLRFETVMRVFFSDYFQREFGIGLKNNLVIPEHRNHAICYKPFEWNKFVKTVYRKVCLNEQTFSRYSRLIKIEQQRFVAVGRRVASGNLRRLSWPELKRRFEIFDHQHLEFNNKPIWIPFPIEPVLSKDAHRELTRALRRVRWGSAKSAIESVFSPERMNAIMREQFDLLRMAIRLKQKPSQKLKIHLLKKHAANFQWLPCYDLNDTPWSLQDFTKLLTGLTHLEKIAYTRGKGGNKDQNYDFVFFASQCAQLPQRVAGWV